MMGHGFFYATFTTSPGIFFGASLVKDFAGDIITIPCQIRLACFCWEKFNNILDTKYFLLPGLGYQDHLD